MPKPMTLRVVTANLKRGAYDRATRKHDHYKLHRMLSTLDEPPHILFLSECTRYDAPDLYSEPLFDVLDILDTSLGLDVDEHGHEYPKGQFASFISKVPGSVNVPGLFIDKRNVRPVQWYDDSQRRVLANSLVAEINGQRIRLKSVHWNGSGGSTLFDQQAAQDGQLAQYAAIIGGDFNATSSHPREVLLSDWSGRCYEQGRQMHKLSQKGIRMRDGSWRVYTEALDSFLQHGWWDAGEAAEDFTVTVNPEAGGVSGLRIDRIMVSHRAPVRPVPGSYKVHVPKPGTEVSDHRMVSCAFEIDAPEAVA